MPAAWNFLRREAMKRGMTLILSVLVSAVLAGCGQQPAGQTVPQTPETTEAAAHVHVYTTETVPASCTSPGYVLHSCACGDSYRTDEVPQLEHTYTRSRLDATCTEGGGLLYTCACGDSYIERTSPPLGHDYQQTEPVPPQGNQRGYTENVCTRCGDTYRGKFTWTNEAMGAYFDDAAFIGDSLTYMLFQYNNSVHPMGNVTFLCRGGVSVHSLLIGQRALTYRGKEYAPEDALKACGAKKVFIMLGINDAPWAGVDKTIENLQEMVRRILEVNPDMEIFLQACSPILKSAEERTMPNNAYYDLNRGIEALAKEKGYHYVDITTNLKLPDGSLIPEYCNDSFAHLNPAGCEVWVNAIKEYVYEENLYDPE